jgi:hypothetical protein
MHMSDLPALSPRLSCPEGTVERGPAAWWIVPILVLGLLLRLTGLWWGQAYFYFGQGDGIEAYSVAVDYANGDAHAQYIGQPNYNIHSKLPGPLWTLVCFAGLRVGKSIEGVIVTVILLNVAAIYLTYLLTERVLGRQAALWAGLLAATLPSAVFYSVGVYNPEVMSFLSACLGLALWSVVRHERSRHIFWVGLLLLAMPQFHMSGLALLPAVAIVLGLSSTRLNFRWLAGGILAGTLLYLPYLMGELAHGWENTRGMMTSDHRGFSIEGLKALSTPLSLLVNWVPHWTRLPGEYRELGRACFGWFGLCLAVNLLSAIVTALLVLGAFQQTRESARGFWRAPRETFNRAPGFVFLAVLLIVPLFGAALIGQRFHVRYGLVVLPPLLALAGGGAARWLAAPRFGHAFAATLALMTCTNIWFMPAYYRYSGNRIEKSEAFVPSFRQLERVYQTLKARAGEERQVAVEADIYLLKLPLWCESYDVARSISHYVSLREKERVFASGSPRQTVTYHLCPAEQVTPGDPKVAYQAHGIALVVK